MYLRLYMTVPCSKVLGPYKRFIIWVQGCKKHCKGCIAKDSWTLDGGDLVEIDTIVQQILHQNVIEGITISGGEPFLQQEALCELIDILHSHRDLGVIVYTGMLYEEISHTPLAKRCDLIVDGEYIEELNDGLSLRGSSNQRVICVSDRYSDIVDTYYELPGRKMEFVIHNGHASMIGIPSKNTEKMISEE